MSDDATRTTGYRIDPDATGTYAPQPGGEVRDPSLPEAIGHYRIIRLLGEGGMGAVYEAEQENPQRRVALKVIRPGMASSGMLHRFQRESQALGRLQHAGIAQIYEAGTADAAFGQQPYFAMELIRGESLRQYADAHRLDTKQRLALMVRICEAVHHAHLRGLIHRDLKPANIMVDETGQPKILDFGIARLIDSDGDSNATRQTDMGQLVGTVAYMSPEQVLANPLEIDIRSDVYALGLILYELLAGRRAYELSRNLHEAVQTIREEDPARLSSVNRLYRGDIETIAAKALEKQKERRYASAEELAEDIRRYLTDKPIEARPASATYQLGKFARRHRTLVAAAATVFLVLIAGVIASTLEAARAGRAERDAIHGRDLATAAQRAATEQRDRAVSAEQAASRERNRAVTAEEQAIGSRNRAVTERQRADTEAATAKAVNDFLQSDLLAQASASNQARPDTRPDPDLKVRTALDRAATRIAGKFGKQPLVEASVRETMGSTYTDLGLYPEAQAQLEIAVALRTRQQGGAHPDTQAAMIRLANLYSLQGKYEQAESLNAKTLEERRRTLGDEDAKTAESMDELAEVYLRRGRFTEAEPLLVKALAVRRRALGEEHRDTLNTMSNLAGLYYNQGKFGEAQALFGKVLVVDRRLLGDEHPDTLVLMNNLAAIYRNSGEYAKAEGLLIDVLQITRRVLGEEHPDTFRRMNNLAIVYVEEGKYPPAEELYANVLAGWRRLLGEEHADTLTAMENLGQLYARQKKYAQAEPPLKRALETRRRVLGEEHPLTLHNVNSLAGTYLGRGGYAEAEGVLREALKNYEKTEPDSWWRFHAESELGASLAGQGKYSEAEPFLISGCEGLVERRAAIPAGRRAEVGNAAAALIQYYRDRGAPEKAGEWSGKLRDVLASAARQP